VPPHCPFEYASDAQMLRRRRFLHAFFAGAFCDFLQFDRLRADFRRHCTADIFFARFSEIYSAPSRQMLQQMIAASQIF